METKTLFNHFEVIEDPRDIRGKKHELISILIMTIYGTLCGYTDFTNMVDFLTLNEEYFINILNLKNGIPSHDTFSRVLAQIKPDKFMDIFIQWIKEIIGNKGLHISIDGKAIKSTRDKINNGNVPYILSGFFCDIGLSIGKIKIDDKTNEITAIPQLLDLIDIKGKIALQKKLNSKKYIILSDKENIIESNISTTILYENNNLNFENKKFIDYYKSFTKEILDYTDCFFDDGSINLKHSFTIIKR